MPQRPRLSPESTPDEVRTTQIEDARQVTARSPQEDARAHFDRRFFEAAEALGKFREALDETPQKALEGSYGAFRAAAGYGTAAHVLNLLNDGHPMRRLIAALSSRSVG
jgi:hypothetical protein